MLIIDKKLSVYIEIVFNDYLEKEIYCCVFNL